MHRYVGLFCAATALAFAVTANAANDKLKAPNTLIRFDTFTPGVQLSDQYAVLGVTFDGTFEGNITAGVIGTDGDYGTYFFGNSQPNFVVIGSGTLSIYFDEPISDFSFRAGDADSDPEAFAVNAFDSDGNLLDSQIVLLFDAGTTVSIAKSGIAEIRIFGITGCNDCYSGFAVDDLSYVR